MFTEPVHSRATQRQQTRAVVLAAAEGLFRTRGFGGTTVRQIANDAGVSVGTVMAAGDKDALLVAIFEGWIRAVHDLRAASSGPVADEDDPVETLLELFAPFVEYFAGDEDLARQYAAIVVRGEHETAIFRDLGDALIREVEDIIRRTRVPEPHVLAAAQTIYLSYLGVLMLAANGAVDVLAATVRLRAVIEFTITGAAQ